MHFHSFSIHHQLTNHLLLVLFLLPLLCHCGGLLCVYGSCFYHSTEQLWHFLDYQVERATKVETNVCVSKEKLPRKYFLSLFAIIKLSFSYCGRWKFPNIINVIIGISFPTSCSSPTTHSLFVLIRLPVNFCSYRSLPLALPSFFYLANALFRHHTLIKAQLLAI